MDIGSHEKDHLRSNGESLV